MSKRKEIDPEFRIWLIEECLAGRMRGQEAARRAGVSSTAMQKWISLYKMDGPAAFASSNAKRTYSEEIKKKVVKDYLNGKGSFPTLCEKYHLRSPELVNRWVKSYNGHKDSKKNSGGFSLSRAKAVFYSTSRAGGCRSLKLPKAKDQSCKAFRLDNSGLFVGTCAAAPSFYLLMFFKCHTIPALLR